MIIASDVSEAVLLWITWILTNGKLEAGAITVAALDPPTHGSPGAYPCDILTTFNANYILINGDNV